MYMQGVIYFFLISDVDECVAGTAECGTGAECANLNGSFACRCLAGFQKSGNDCTGLTISTFHAFIYLQFQPKLNLSRPLHMYM